MSMKDYTDISPKERRRVRDRDSIEDTPCCIFCGSPYNIEIAHYVPRSRGGIGQRTNLACLCRSCHATLDNGADNKKADEIREVFKDWLMRNYPNWTEEEQIYRKANR